MDQLRPIESVAKDLGLTTDEVIPYGGHKAKVRMGALAARRHAPDGKLVLVSAITPTPAGEGKTTTSIGLTQGLCRRGRRAVAALREPSLGPVFGVKGGGTGGGRSQVVPMEDINLHFTGDIHAVGSAHNLLAAALDNHLFQGNELHLDPRQVLWRRAMDMNDRALRQIVVGLGGRVQGVPREDGFLITAASEVMALLCLSNDLMDLKARLGRILVGVTYDGKPVLAEALGVTGAMAALLRDAIHPNLVQTSEGMPALVHGGPFGNIAHGCNSVIATRLALKLGEICVTEAGFAFDLGAEKFCDIKCRYAGLAPDAVVLVATARALKYHGGVPTGELTKENVPALDAGVANLEKHLESVAAFGLPAVVAVNRFASDTQAELDLIRRRCDRLGVPAVVADVYAQGGAGALELADAVWDTLQRRPARFAPLYEWDQPVKAKIERIARIMYGARGVYYTKAAHNHIERAEALGYGALPICMAKTQQSLSDDPSLAGRPKDFEITVRELRISAGAGFLVPITGDVLTMPGLPKKPAAMRIDVDGEGRITGLT